MCLMGHHDEDLDVICHLYHSEFDKEHIRVRLLLLGVDFDVVTADGAMNIFHVKKHFLSLSQSAIANVSSGRTSPVHSQHSCNECYIGEIVNSVRYDISFAFERFQNVCPDCDWMNKFSLFVFGIIKMYLLKMRLALKTVPVPCRLVAPHVCSW